jgi:hypothetical protein
MCFKELLPRACVDKKNQGFATAYKHEAEGLECTLCREVPKQKTKKTKKKLPSLP